MSKKKNSRKPAAEKAKTAPAEKIEETAEEKIEETPAEMAEETVEERIEEAAGSAGTLAETEEEIAEEAADDSNDVSEEKTEDDPVESEEKSDDDIDDKSEKKSAKKEKELTPEQRQKREERARRRSLKERAFKRGWFSIALVALFIAAVIIVNLIATTLVEKVPALVADTTGSGSFALTDETIDYLSKLDEKIEIFVLTDEKTYREGGQYYIQADSLLHQYEDNSGLIKLTFVDLASDPTFTSRYPDEQLAQYSLIVQGENDYKYLATTDYFDVQVDYSSYSYYIAGCKVEEAVTSAILNVTLDDKPKAAFLAGISDEDYSAFRSYLESNGFETEELTPAISDIPDDADILVLYAPNTDLDASYVDKISAFLSNGGEYGKQLLYLPSASLAERPNIDSLLEEWGIGVENGYAVENDMNKIQQISYGVYLFAGEYKDTTYTEKMKNADLPFCVFYGNGVYTHPVSVNDAAKASTLVSLSEQAQIVYPSESNDEAEPTFEDSPSLAIGAIATKGSTKSDTDSEADEGATVTNDSHIVVFGSNYVVTETFLSSTMYGNAPYMLSLLNTLVGRDNVGVQIDTQSLESETLSITTAQLGILTLLFVVVLPIAILIAGFVIFMKRRNL